MRVPKQLDIGWSDLLFGIRRLFFTRQARPSLIREVEQD